MDHYEYMRAVTLHSALSLHVATDGSVIPAAGVNRKAMLAIASSYTGEKYKNTLSGCRRALQAMAGIINPQEAV